MQNDNNKKILFKYFKEEIFQDCQDVHSQFRVQRKQLLCL